ncbi:MAG: outer membrane channel protein TolC [Vibrionaceae bacterium]
MKNILAILISASFSCAALNANAEDLLQIYQQAKESDSTTLQAAATKDAAFAAINTKRATLLPQINLNAGYNLSRNNKANISSGLSDTNTLAAGVSLNQSIYNRSSWINLNISELNARQADANYAAIQQALILRVANAYFNVLRAEEGLQFIRAEKAAVGRQLEQTKQRFEVGLSAITDVHDAQAQYDSVLASEIQADNALVNSYEGLRQITGQGYSKLKKLNTKLFSASSPTGKIEELVTQAQEKNLSLLAARINSDAAKLNIKLAQSGHLPTLGLNVGYDILDQENQTNAARDTTYNQFSGGINLNLPIYSGGAVSAQVDSAKYSYIASAEALDGQFRAIVRDTRAFYNNINASIGTLRAFGQTVISAQSSLKATQAGFEVGTRTIVDVLNATRRLYDANRNLSNARYDYILNRLQLSQAIGTLNEQDLVDINSGLTD